MPCARAGEGTGIGGPRGGRRHFAIDDRELRRALESHGIDRVRMLHPLFPDTSVTVDVTLIDSGLRDGNPIWFPPRPCYVTAEPFDWYVYRSDSDESGEAAGFIDKRLKP